MNKIRGTSGLGSGKFSKKVNGDSWIEGSWVLRRDGVSRRMSSKLHVSMISEVEFEELKCEMNLFRRAGRIPSPRPIS